MPSGLSNGTNARALDPILQVSLSSSRSLTPYVGGAIGLVLSLDLGGTLCRILFWPRSQERFWSSCHHLLNHGITHAIVFLCWWNCCGDDDVPPDAWSPSRYFLFSKMEYNHVMTKFPNSGLQTNIVNSAHICRFGGNLRLKWSAWLMSGQLNLAIT